MVEKKKTPAGRGTLKSMRGTAGMLQFVLDQLAGVPGLRSRAMFGGVGLYAGDVFFAILAADVLYFKVDDRTRPDYEAEGSTAFKPYADREMVMPYYNVPAAVLEDARRARTWAARAIDVATSARARKGGSTSKPARRSR